MFNAWRAWAAIAWVVLSTSLVVAAVVVDDPLPVEDSTETSVRMREGARLDGVSGWFKPTVDRVEFHVGGGTTKVICLENLALERIVEELDAEVTLIWQIDGQLTEYHGRNYLLVERAFVKSTLER